MKKYRSHKVVEAAKITEMQDNPDGSHELLFADRPSIRISTEWFLKHSDGARVQLAGGYFVRYKGGYESWSPADAFESGYSPAEDDTQDDRVKWHPPSPPTQVAHTAIREGVDALLKTFEASVPDVEDRAEAIKCLRSAMMWANSAIALNHHLVDPEFQVKE